MNAEIQDIVICGGGCSAMLLLHQLKEHPHFETLKILVIEKGEPDLQKTWCFWHKGNHPLQHLITNSWKYLQFSDQYATTLQAIQPYTYSSIKAENFFRYFYNHFIPNHPNIRVIKDEVIGIEKGTNELREVVGNKGRYLSTTVYSSIIDKAYFKAPIFIWQHFKGWHIRTKEDVFDAKSMTLMDFSVCGSNSCDFVYTLPFSDNEALIEFTAFSTDIWSDDLYLNKFNEYVKTKLKGVEFTIVSMEQGNIPMAYYNHSAIGRSGEIYIGNAAGKIKATTGYGFEKMQLHAEKLAASYFRKSSFSFSANKRFKFYDKLLLRIIHENPNEAVTVFSALFKKTPMVLILKFLNEETSLFEEALIFKNLPFIPFLKRL